MKLIRAAEFSIVFTTGFVLYPLLERIFKGSTHWSMAVAGGLCLAIVYLLSTRAPLSLWLNCLAGALAITAVEFIAGCAVNLWAGWNVWSYAREPLNLLGQVCVKFTFLWYALCIPLTLLSRRVYGLLFAPETKRGPA